MTFIRIAALHGIRVRMNSESQNLVVDFLFLRSEYTGALFVLVKNTTKEYDGFILNTEDDIQQYLDAFGLTPAETNRPIEINRITPKKREKTEIDKFISSLNEEFPSSEKMSHVSTDY